MTAQSSPRWLQLRIAKAIHRAAIRVAPAAVRAEHAGQMHATFDAVVTDAATRGRVAIARVLAREVADLLKSRWSDPLVHQLSSVQSSRSPMLAFLSHLPNPRDLWLACRSLAHRPSFAAAAIVTLTCGTAATTTLFGVVDTVLLKPLPYPDADRLVTIQETNSSKRGQASLVAPGRLEDWNRLNHSFESLSGTYAENVTDTSGDVPERLDARRVTRRFFEVYAARPLAGRVFLPEEESSGGPKAAVISEGFWTRRFNRAADAVGMRLRIGGDRYAIVGVMPASFTAATTDLWLPAQVSPQLLAVREARFLTGVGRLKPGVTSEQGLADLKTVQASLGQQFPKSDRDWSVTINSLKNARIGAQRETLWIAFGAVGLLWLIGVANMAGLTLVQLHRRSREVAIRTAIGASRGDVVALVLRESVVLSVVSGVAGALVAAAAIGLVRTTFTTLPRLNELRLDWRAVLFAAGTSLVAAVLFGLWPALHATRRGLSASLATATRGSSARHHLQRVLVSAQVALSVLLVGSAALLGRSYVNLSGTDLGFDAYRVLTFHLGARWDEDRNRIGELQAKFVEGLQRLPGVEAAGFANFLPTMPATLRYQVSVEGLAGPESNGTMTVGSRMIAGTYLQALHVPVVAGAACPPLRHDFNATPSAIVNKRFVEEFAGGQNLVGRSLRYVQSTSSATIVGVIADVGEDPPGSGPMPFVYTCDSAGSWPDPEYVVRTKDPSGAPRAIRELARSLDAQRAVFGLKPLADVTTSALDQPRLTAGTIGTFAAAAMALAALGLYSLFMLLVGENTREIGVRMALGATPRSMTRLILFGAGRLLSIGLVVGLVLNAAAARLIASLLFGVTPMDPVTLAGAVLVLVGVSVVAVAVPAARAGRVDPIVAMRSE